VRPIRCAVRESAQPRTANQHFAQEILPMLFRHSNTASFIRQLNMYGMTRLRAFACASLCSSA
jgi:hypothetical protein